MYNDKNGINWLNHALNLIFRPIMSKHTDEDLMDVGVKRSEKVCRIKEQTYGGVNEKKTFSCGRSKLWEM